MNVPHFIAPVQISLCHCLVESKNGRIRRVKYWDTLAILASLSASIALADDFKTVNGKEYKDATVTRVEPDGIVLRTKSGISKIYFVEYRKRSRNHFITIRERQRNPAQPKLLNSSNYRRRLQPGHLTMSSLRSLRVSGPSTNGKSKQPLQPGSLSSFTGLAQYAMTVPRAAQSGAALHHVMPEYGAGNIPMARATSR